MRHLLAALSIAVLPFLLPAAAHSQAAAGVAPADARAAQAVVRAQLDAFAADDARKAFSYAAPEVQGMFGTPERFMEMVRTGYGVVYRPASVNFMPPEADDGGVILRVQMTDRQGASWLATYRLVRMPDRSWRIGACVLAPNQGRAA